MTNSVGAKNIKPAKSLKTIFMFGTNNFQSLSSTQSNSDSSFSDAEFDVTIDDEHDTVLDTKETDISDAQLNDTYSILENVPLSQRKANNSIDQDENHLKAFTGSESFERERKEVLADISNKKSSKQKLLKAFTPNSQMKDRWEASVEGNSSFLFLVLISCSDCRS